MATESANFMADKCTCGHRRDQHLATRNAVNCKQCDCQGFQPAAEPVGTIEERVAKLERDNWSNGVKIELLERTLQTLMDPNK